MQSKICQSCGNVFYKKQNESKKYWGTKRYCSKGCSLKFTSVKRFGGNKGRIVSDETKKKLSLALTGRPANSGCFKKGMISHNKGKKLPEQSGEKNPNWKPKIKINCLYCGEELNIAPWRFKQGTKWCNRQHYMQWRRGENNPRYKGDKAIVKLRKRIMELAEYSEWHAAVLKRDHYLCQECHTRGEGLEVHHLESIMSILQRLQITTIEQARECKELWGLNNGQTLCRRCHRKTDSYGRQAIKT